MPLRGLELEQFVHHVEPACFQRYFEALLSASPPGFWQVMNADAMLKWINESLTADARSVVLEDFTRVNQISRHGMNLLVQAYARAGMERDDKSSREQLGMVLFLDDREAFDFAWARHLFHSSDSKLTLHKVTLDALMVEPQSREAFEVEIRRWFAGQAKGDFCRVKAYKDGEQHIFLLAHGSYVRTFAYLQGDRIAFQSFRPAAEDILVYDQRRSLLEIKAALAKDRERYLEAFATCIVRNPDLIEDAKQTEVLTLRPLQAGTFDFTGDGDEVRDVTLLKVRLTLPTASHPVIEVRSTDIQWTFSGELGDLRLDSGDLLYAKFRFRLRPRGQPEARVTFEIEPPDRTDLVQKKYADLIERYLEEQGVKIG